MVKMCQTFVSNINNNQKVYRPKSSSTSMSFYVKSDWLIWWMCAWMRASTFQWAHVFIFIFILCSCDSLWASTFHVMNGLEIFYRMQQLWFRRISDNIHFSSIIIENERKGAEEPQFYFVLCKHISWFWRGVYRSRSLQTFFAYFHCIIFINMRESRCANRSVIANAFVLCVFAPISWACVCVCT